MASPFLDVADLLLDPDIADTFSVIRNKQTVSLSGIAETLNSYTFRNVIGVVTAASPNDLEMLPEVEYQTKAISIVTKFRLRGVADVSNTQFQPDLVVWHGDNFKVETVEDYGGFGAGFVQAIARSIDHVDAPPAYPRPPYGVMLLDDQINSQLAGVL
jgi:hypothetical protein